MNLHGTARYPDITAVTNRLDDLYGATLGTLVRRKGETRFVGFYADFIEDAFVPDGEAVFAPMLELATQTLYEGGSSIQKATSSGAGARCA